MRYIALLLVSGAALASVTIRAAEPQNPPEAPKPAPGNALDFTGRIEAATIEIRPRVTGFLEKILVKEGAMVKQGDLLAEIDPRQYKADLEVSRAKFAVAVAGSKSAAANLALVKRAITKGVVSEEALTQADAEQERAEALVKVAKGEVELAELNLTWTKLASPMTGRVGRFTQTAGSLLTSDGQAVVVIVATDPLFVAFDVDERTILKLRRDGVDVEKLTATAGLADEEGFPHKVAVDFIDPQFNRTTNTVRVRGVLANPKGLISPGMFVRVRLTPMAK
jgi:RND family efflux transporter MFP subunit